MTSEPDIKKRIALNTIFLYMRMLLTIVIGLITTRLVLLALGKSDFGIFGVVGGIVYMLGFLNSAMLQASQRFISYALGMQDTHQLRLVFSTSLLTHLAIALIVLVISETAGLWFINNHLNIPDDRMAAANWVFQFSVLTCLVSIFNVPFNSCIVAHERMRIYAYFTIFEAVGKLLIVFLLNTCNVDKLILYSGLLFLIQFLSCSAYALYCRHCFDEVRAPLVFDKPLFGRMFKFASWSIIGNLGFSLRNQGSNIVLNWFFGTVLNAARSIGTSISAIVNSFAGNFLLALNPQITQQYAQGRIDKSAQLVYSGSRLSFCLFLLLAIPLLIHTDYILELWLSKVPQYSDFFVRCIILSALFYSISQPLTIAIQATGRIMWFQIIICVLLLLELPAAYFILKLGAPPYAVMYPTVVTSFIAIFIRLFCLKFLVPFYNVRQYISEVLFRSFILFTVCLLSAEILHRCFPYHSLFGFLFVLSATEIAVLLFTTTIGLKKQERSMVLHYLKNRLHINHE